MFAQHGTLAVAVACLDRLLLHYAALILLYCQPQACRPSSQRAHTSALYVHSGSSRQLDLRSGSCAGRHNDHNLIAQRDCLGLQRSYDVRTCTCSTNTSLTRPLLPAVHDVVGEMMNRRNKSTFPAELRLQSDVSHPSYMPLYH